MNDLPDFSLNTKPSILRQRANCQELSAQPSFATYAHLRRIDADGSDTFSIDKSRKRFVLIIPQPPLFPLSEIKSENSIRVALERCLRIRIVEIVTAILNLHLISEPAGLNEQCSALANDRLVYIPAQLTICAVVLSEAGQNH